MPTRKELKQKAKISMRGRKPSIYLITLLYVAISYVLAVLAYKVMMPGFNPFLGITEADLMNINVGPASQVLNLAISVMTIMLGVGYTIVCLNVSRGMYAGFGELFDGFGMFFKFLWLNILIGIFTFLWSLLFVIPGIVASYRYRMAIYIMIDNPEFSAMECIRRSKAMMAGRKWELFVLDLSFIGWGLLTAIPFVSLYVSPYIEITVANYYNALSGYIPQADYTVHDDANDRQDKDPWD